MEPRTSRIRWLGHVERSTGWIAEVSKLNVVAYGTYKDIQVMVIGKSVNRDL